MNDKRKKFCIEVAKGAAPEEARILAGYKKVGMEKQLLANAEVLAMITELKEEMGQEIAKNDEILFFLTNAMRGENDTDMRLRMKAAELLGKRIFDKDASGDDNSPIIIVDDVK